MDTLLASTPARKTGVVQRTNLLVSPVVRTPVISNGAAPVRSSKKSPMRSRPGGERSTPSPRKRLDFNGGKTVTSSPLKKRPSPASTPLRVSNSAAPSSASAMQSNGAVDDIAKLCAELDATKLQLAAVEHQRDDAQARLSELQAELDEQKQRHHASSMFLARGADTVRKENDELLARLASADERLAVMSADFQRATAQQASAVAEWEQRLVAADQRHAAVEQRLHSAQQALVEAERAHVAADAAHTSELQSQLDRARGEFEAQQQQHAAELVLCQQSVVDAQREYFFSAALALKLGLFANGREISFAVQPHYEELVATGVPFQQWPQWIQQRISVAAAAQNRRR